MPPKTHDRRFDTWQRVLLGALTCLLPFASLWFCQTATAQQNQNPGREMLSAAGVGAELLATAKNGTLEAFPAAEFELFAALSEAILSFDAQPPTEKTSKFNLKQILQRPQQCRGDFVLVEGRVRRVTPIAIRSPQLIERLGRKTYYQVDLFVSTNQTNFQIKDRQGELTLSGTFGITLILFDLPKAISLSDATHPTIRVPGFFIKNWAHKTLATRDVSSELRRPNPIVFGIASMVSVPEAPPTASSDTFVGWFWGILLLFVTVLFAWPWLRGKKNRAIRERDHSAVDLSHLE